MRKKEIITRKREKRLRELRILGRCSTKWQRKVENKSWEPQLMLKGFNREGGKPNGERKVKREMRVKRVEKLKKGRFL